jgi:hypothetical protein
MPGVHDRTAVLEALDALPPHSWFLVCMTLRGLVDGLGRVVVDDPEPERAVCTAIDAFIERLENPNGA